MQWPVNCNSDWPAHTRGMSASLFIFIVFSIGAHGLLVTLQNTSEIDITEQRLGSNYISVTLIPASNTSKKDSPPQHFNAQPTEVVTKKLEQAFNEILRLTAPTPNNFPMQHGTQRYTADAPAEQKTSIKQEPFKQTKELNLPSLVSQQTEKAIIDTDTRQLQQNYLLGEIQNQLSRYFRYPPAARRRGWEGEVIVAFNINEHGQLNNVRLAQSSGYSLLDRSAITAIAKLDNIALPNSMGRLQAMELQLPVRYELRES